MEQPVSYKKAVASLSLGIISIVCAFGFFYTSFFGVVFGILAIIFGQKARKEAKTPLADCWTCLWYHWYFFMRIIVCGMQRICNLF